MAAGRLAELLQRERLRESRLGRFEQAGLEHVEIAGRPERIGEPTQFLGRPSPLVFRQQLSEGRQRRAQPAHRDPHLMDTVGDSGEHRGFVAR